MVSSCDSRGCEESGQNGCQASRRAFLRFGGLGALSLFWTDWLRAGAAHSAGRGKARSVILIFNCGAPSHLDLWDMKPDAPQNVRGPFKPIATNIPGICISELMPRLAGRADKYAIVRTVHHGHGQHNSGMYWTIVGRPYPQDSTLINPSRKDCPGFGPLVGWLAKRNGYSGTVPPYVITPRIVTARCTSLRGSSGAAWGRRYRSVCPECGSQYAVLSTAQREPRRFLDQATFTRASLPSGGDRHPDEWGMVPRF